MNGEHSAMADRRRMPKPGAWVRAGEIGVDAGLCWVGDPCYCVTPDANEHPAETWQEFCEQLPGSDDQHDNGVKQWNFRAGHPGLGVSVSIDDGCYPVYVRRACDGRIAELRVVFVE